MAKKTLKSEKKKTVETLTHEEASRKNIPTAEFHMAIPMSDLTNDANYRPSRDVQPERVSNRMSVEEIAQRLEIGRLAVYTMLEQQIIPGIRLGRRWIITRHAYEQWERTCGMRAGAGLHTRPEVTVLN